MNRSTFASAAIAFGIATAVAASASVISLTLREMLERADSAVLGRVTNRAIWHGTHPAFPDGIDYTTITVEGEDLVQGKTLKRDITYLGSDAMPVSEMPASNETKVGTRALFFSKAVGSEWGGRSGLNSLIAAQNGVFRVEAGPKGEVVLGKGEGAAIESNLFVADVRKQVAAELDQIRRAKK